MLICKHWLSFSVWPTFSFCTHSNWWLGFFYSNTDRTYVMFLKQEEWFLNQLKTEIPEHLHGHPQTDQQSLKKKVKNHFLQFDTGFKHTTVHSQDYINLCTHRWMRLFPFLGFKNNKYQQFGTPFLHSQV